MPAAIFHFQVRDIELQEHFRPVHPTLPAIRTQLASATMDDASSEFALGERVLAEWLAWGLRGSRSRGRR